MLDLKTLKVGDKFIIEPIIYTVTQWIDEEGKSGSQFDCVDEFGKAYTFLACVMKYNDWHPYLPTLKEEEW